jgi:hypothetical protein
MTATFFPVMTSDETPPPPRGWRWALLGEIARLESGHTPSRREPSYWNEGDVPWLSLKDVRRIAGRYVYSTEDRPTQKGIDNSSARLLPKGTVAFCRTASVGKVAILGRDMATSQDFANWVCGPNTTVGSLGAGAIGESLQGQELRPSAGGNPGNAEASAKASVPSPIAW